MFRLRSLFLASLFAVAFSTSAFADPIPQSFTISGSGFGHGVGLSQIGAKGQALAGKTADAILAYYFPGTTLASYADNSMIRVNVGHQLNSVNFALDKGFPTGAFQLVKGDPKMSTPIDPTSDSSLGIFGLGSTVNFSIAGKTIKASFAATKTAKANTAIASIFTIRISGTDFLPGVPSGVFMTSSAPSMRLHYGQIQIRAVPVTGLGYRIEVTDSMRLHDQYLYGVSEVPSSWPSAAMQAQAIAARTYAISRMSKIRKECDCNIYSTTADQSYVGYTKEAEPGFGKYWKAAVDQTLVDSDHGLVILYNNLPINVYFFSSSGGATQRSQDVWGTSYPYLVSVPDPWSLDDGLNPGYAHWQRTIAQTDMAKAFGLPDVIRYEVLTRSLTNSVLSVVGYSSTGDSKVLSVGEFKSRVKLPSSWFDLPNVPTPSPTPTTSPSPSGSSSPSPSASDSGSGTPSPTASVSATPVASATPSSSPS